MRWRASAGTAWRGMSTSGEWRSGKRVCARRARSDGGPAGCRATYCKQPKLALNSACLIECVYAFMCAVCTL